MTRQAESFAMASSSVPSQHGDSGNASSSGICGVLFFIPEYRRVIAMTPGVRVRARLPWELKIPMIVLLVLYLISCAYIDR
jgi:hypothetical protein